MNNDVSNDVNNNVSNAVNNYDYDLLVIGAGSGGVRAARMAAGFGARVAIVENRYMGGTCVNVGCVPKKLYVYAAEYGKGFKDARGFGWRTDWHNDKPRFDWATLRDNKENRDFAPERHLSQDAGWVGRAGLRRARPHYRCPHGGDRRRSIQRGKVADRNRRLAQYSRFSRQ